MSVLWCAVGGVTDSQAVFTGEVDGNNASLVYSTSPDLTNRTVVDPSSGGGTVPFRWNISGLDHSETYWFALWDVDNDEDPDTSKSGSFQTDRPIGSEWSHRVRVVGDSGLDPDYPGEDTTTLPATRSSNAPILSEIADYSAAITSDLGDWHYGNAGDGSGTYVPDASVATLRGIMRDQFRQSHQAKIARQPRSYVYDDHDAIGGNNSDGSHPDKENLAQVYREFIPSYDLHDAGAIYHAFQKGRVLYIAADTRYYRTPNSEPDGPEKTMLGTAQITWMQDLLQNTTAEAFVWLMPTPWLGGSSDTWDGFAYERDALTSWLQTTTVPASGETRSWAESMTMVNADIHGLGLSTGDNNPYGGFPVLLAAAIDSTPSTSAGSNYDIGYRAGREQWGSVSVADAGSQIDITLTGWVGTVEWNSLSTTIVTPSDDNPAPPAVAEPSSPANRAEPIPVINWYAYDLQTLRRVAKVRGVNGNLARALGSIESTTLDVPTPLSGPLANRLVTHQVTAPNTLMVAEINKVPAWTGIVWKTEETSEGGLRLGCKTPESYLDRRYTGTISFNQAEQVNIMATLAAKAADSVGIPIEFHLEETGIRRDRTYSDDEDATLYQRIDELAEVINGPEWTMRAEYIDEWGTQLRLIFDCRAHIGASKDNPKGPISTYGKARATWKLTNDWNEGKGANSIIATSSGEGEDRPQSVAIEDIQSNHPKIEYRFSPSSSIKNVSPLNDHSNSKLEEIGHGTRSLKVSARWDQTPVRLGVDIDIGDWTEYDLYGPTRPTGMHEVKRMIGYKLRTNAGQFDPVFLEA